MGMTFMMLPGRPKNKTCSKCGGKEIAAFTVYGGEAIVSLVCDDCGADQASITWTEYEEATHGVEG